MEILANFARQLRDLWNRGDGMYRVGLIAAVLFVTGTMAAVGYWASRPQYVPLSDNLSVREASLAMEQLTMRGIPAEFSYAGSTILVPESRWNEARVAASEVLGEPSESSGDESGSLMFSDPDTKKFRLRQQKENFLARTIIRMKTVSSADVHLAIPEPSPFSRDRNPPKATVVVGTKRGAELTPDQASTIAKLISGSVDGLDVANVTVSDLNGRTLYPNAESMDGGWSRRQQIKIREETRLADKAETMLARSLGPGNVKVAVTADIDFTEKQSEEKRMDPDGGVKLKETINSTKSEGGSAGAAGVAGSGANLAPSGANAAGNNSGTSSTEMIETEYEPSMVRNVTTEYGGKITRLSISAIVDIPPADEGAADATPMTLARAEALIKTAVGYDAERGDEITVEAHELTPLDTEIDTLVDTLNRWDFYNNLVRKRVARRGGRRRTHLGPDAHSKTPTNTWCSRSE